MLVNIISNGENFIHGCPTDLCFVIVICSALAVILVLIVRDWCSSTMTNLISP